MMKRSCWAVLIGIALFHPYNELRAACSCDWLCIEQSHDSAEFRLLARNPTPVPITFSVQFNNSAIVNGPSSMTRTLAAGETSFLPAIELKQGYSNIRRSYRCQWTIGNKDAEHDEQLTYMLPYESGRSYRVLQGFGSRFSHTGIEQFAVDFKMSEGTPVHAARGGLVARTVESNSVGCWRDECAGRANFIVILHDDETTGEYYHLKKDGVLVQVGDVVKAGQKIGLSGNTGHSALPHLHFGVYRAMERGKEQSIPFRFLSADGIVDQPRRGGMYVAIRPEDAGMSDDARRTNGDRTSTTGE